MRTNPGWPDPTDWVNRLKAKLDARGNGYLELTAARNRNPGSYTDGEESIEAACTLQVGGIVASIMTALCEFPAFEEHPSIVALNDLVLALTELANGGSPILLKRLTSDEHGPPEPLHDLGVEVVIGYAVLCLRLLKKGCDYSDIRARTALAEVFARHGYRGIKGGPLSASTLQSWQRRYERFTADNLARESIEQLWSEWTSEPGWRSNMTTKTVMAYIEKVASAPALRNKATTSQPR